MYPQKMEEIMLDLQDKPKVIHNDKPGVYIVISDQQTVHPIMLCEQELDEAGGEARTAAHASGEMEHIDIMWIMPVEKFRLMMGQWERRLKNHPLTKSRVAVTAEDEDAA